MSADDSLRLWSVTTLIKLGLGTSEALVGYAVGETATAALRSRNTLDAMLRDEGEEAALAWLKGARYRSSAKAKARGSDVHRAAEQLAIGASPLVDATIRPYVDQYLKFLRTFEPRFLMAEAPVYNPEWRYAGTLDNVVELGGRNLLWDIKTTPYGPDDRKPDGQLRMRPPYPEVALQLCAYSRCTEVGVLSEQRYDKGKRFYVYDPKAKHEPLPRVDGALCVVVSPFDCFAVPVRIDDTVWDAWLSVLDCARWTLAGGRELFGAALIPEREEAA